MAVSLTWKPQSARRRSRSVWRALLRVIELGILAGVVCGGVYALWVYVCTSGRFLVKTVRVEGAAVLNVDEIAVQSGVTDMSNVLFLDLEEVRKRVEEMPYVKTCKASRIFPDKLVLAIEEREAVATLLVNNRSLLVDREGVVLRELATREMPEGPFITEVPNLGFVEMGQRLSDAPLLAALSVWDAFRRTTMAKEVTVSEIAAPHEDDIRMYCDELLCEIRWGRRDFVGEARRLDLLWEAVGKDLPCKEYLDLRFGDDMVCR